MTDATPEPIEPEISGQLGDGNGTDNGTDNGNLLRERIRSVLRAVFAVALGVLLVGDVALYSLHKALEARVESQDRRIERMNSMLTDLLSSRDNAARIELIETQVDGIGKAVEDLQQLVKDTRPPTEPPPEESTSKPKK